jgi:hypothetical protein
MDTILNKVVMEDESLLVSNGVTGQGAPNMDVTMRWT